MKKFIFKDGHRFPCAFKSMEDEYTKYHLRVIRLRTGKYDVIYETRFTATIVPHTNLGASRSISKTEAPKRIITPYLIKSLQTKTGCTENTAKFALQYSDCNIDMAVKYIEKGNSHETDKRN